MTAETYGNAMKEFEDEAMGILEQNSEVTLS